MSFPPQASQLVAAIFLSLNYFRLVLFQSEQVKLDLSGSNHEKI
jgi:hypothetical protein